MVVIAGAHAFTPHHYSPGPALPPGLTVAQLDSDPDEIGRNFPADAGLVGALGPSLHRLAELLRERVPAHTAKGHIQQAGSALLSTHRYPHLVTRARTTSGAAS
ncbi:hypothetical protein [Streptomyces dysideae]|uniref:hypothetical protein n=1 Tax=Streptomyces dysideae TaxID=909626 RepID=UPI000AB12E39